MKVIGVLALQGAFAKHIKVLTTLNVLSKEVRTPKDLEECDALIIPGGESTTMMHQMQFIGLDLAIIEFAKKKPLFGTCAGIILMASHIIGDKMKPFNLLDVDIERNAYGRQIESFVTTFDAELTSNLVCQVKGVFIRAPRICRWGKDVQVLAKLDDKPILVRQGRHLGATFHPELTDSDSVHRYFLEIGSLFSSP